MKTKLSLFIIFIIIITKSISSNTSNITKDENSNKAETLVVIAPEVKLRSTPSQQASIVTKITYGEAVKKISFDKNWYKVSYQNKTGYIFKTGATTEDHLKKIQQLLKPRPVNDPEKALFIVPSNGALLREKPDRTSTAVKALPSGTKLQALSEINHWYQVKAGDAIGFVHVSVVSEVEPIQPKHLTYLD